MITFASITCIALTGCTDRETPAVEKTNTIVIEKEVPVREVPKKEEGTSISIDKNGVEFSKKEGDTKVDIDLKDK